VTTVSENYKSLAEVLACAEKDAKRGFQVDFIIKDSEMVLERIATKKYMQKIVQKQLFNMQFHNSSYGGSLQ
jgi:hypothetical protein